jgi:hypothetical protein
MASLHFLDNAQSALFSSEPLQLDSMVTMATQCNLPGTNIIKEHIKNKISLVKTGKKNILFH